MRSTVFMVSGVAASASNSFTQVVDICMNLQDEFNTELKHAQVSLATTTSEGEGELHRYKNEIARQAVVAEGASAKEKSCSARESSGKQLAADLSGRISLLGKDTEAATQVNTLEQNECGEKQSKLVTLVNNLRSAQDTLKSQHSNSFAQVSAMVQELTGEAPQATTTSYESGVSGLIKLVNDLLGDTSQQLEDSKTQCRNSKQSYDLLVRDLSAQKTSESQELDTARAGVSQATQCKSTAQTTLDQAEVALKSLNKQLLDAQVELQSATDDSSQQITDLKNSLGGLGQVLEHLRDVQPATQNLAMVAGVFLVQLHSTPSESVSAFVAKRATELRSSTLSALATKLAASTSNDFSRIKEMIKQLIANLQDEATADTTRNSQCELEQAAQKAERNRLTEEINKLTADKMQSSAAIQQASQRLGDIQNEVAGIQSRQASADQTRAVVKQENEQLLADADNAAKALAKSIEIIEALPGLSSLLGTFKTLIAENAALLQDTKKAELEAAGGHKKQSNARALDLAGLDQTNGFAQQDLETNKGALNTAGKGLADNQRMSEDHAKVEAATTTHCSAVLSPEEKIKKKQQEKATLEEVLQFLS